MKRGWLAACCALALGGCAEDPAPECSMLRYDTVAEPFIASWCRGCHSASLPIEERKRAPINVTFESHADFVRWAPRIVVRTIESETMPPVGGPSAKERELLALYLACGSPR